MEDVCLNGWSLEEISINFGTVELDICSRCKYLKYSNGELICLKEDNNEY